MNFDRDKVKLLDRDKDKLWDNVNFKKFDFWRENLIFRQNRYHFRIAHGRFSIAEKKVHRKRMENTVFT